MKEKEKQIEHYKKLSEQTREEVEQEVRAEYHKKFILMYRSFNSEIEKTRFASFLCRHCNHCKASEVPYLIPYETPLGTGYDAYCPGCEEKEDITDYSAW